VAYALQADVESAVGGRQRLVELCDDQGNGKIDATLLSAQIAAADGWIDGFLQERHATPLSPVPQVVKDLSARNTAFLLKQRRRALEEDDRLQRQEDYDYLLQVSKGLLSLGTEPQPSKSSQDAAKTIDRDAVDEEDNSRTNTRGFW